jgi:hypothetical protein
MNDNLNPFSVLSAAAHTTGGGLIPDAVGSILTNTGAQECEQNIGFYDDYSSPQTIIVQAHYDQEYYEVPVPAQFPCIYSGGSISYNVYGDVLLN